MMTLPADCPPKDAYRTTLTVYRLVKSDPPAPSDFVPVAHVPQRNITPQDLCCAHGLSVFEHRADAEEKKRLFKNLRACDISVGTISPSDGLVKQTFKPSHHTWWVECLQPHLLFEVAP